MQRMAALSLTAVPAIAAVAWFNIGPAGGETVRIPYQAPDRVAEGKGLYAEHCAVCHGENLEGAENWRTPDASGLLPAPPHDETGHTWHHADDLLFRITRLGTAAVVGGGYESNMPAFADTLSDDDILSILAFIKSTWPDRVIETHNELNERAG